MALRDYLRNYSVTIPTLYKHYTELCEDGGVEFLGFNIDEDFNDCIDGFILVKIDKVKEKKRKRYIKS
jgi:Cdc6-like AAA superfamily ATPase